LLDKIEELTTAEEFLSDIPKLIETMASCHSIKEINGRLVGDPVDLRMHEFTNWVSLLTSPFLFPPDLKLTPLVRPSKNPTSRSTFLQGVPTRSLSPSPMYHMYQTKILTSQSSLQSALNLSQPCSE